MYKSINIPEILKNYSYWGYWRHIYKEGQPKPSKVPYRVDGKPASPSNSDDWTTFDKAILSYNNSVANGLGFLIDMKHPVCFVDVDNCIDGNGNLSKIAQEIVVFFKSYTEVSQSGKGIHILFEGNKDYIDILLKWNKNIELGLEFYIDKRYCAITGDVYNELRTIRQVPNLDVAEFIDKYKPRAKDNSVHSNKTLDLSTQKKVNEYLKSKNFKKSPKLSDEDILSIIANSKQAEKFNQLYNNSGKYVSDDESSNDISLCNILAFYTQDIKQIARIWRSSKLNRAKLDRNDYVYKFTIHNAILGLTDSYKPSRTPWDKDFVDYVKGQVVPKLSVTNVERLFEIEDISARYNEMSKEVEFNGITIEDKDDVIVKDFAVKHGFTGVSFSSAYSYINAIAVKNSYHPVREYLDNLILVDSNKEFMKLANTLNLVNEDERYFVNMLLKKWFISCVAAIYEPNFRGQGVLTLQGEGGIQKSTWLSNLVPDEKWFQGEFVGFDVGNRDAIQKVAKYWITELSELESTFKKDFTALRGFITSNSDEYRSAYDRRLKKYKRQTVFCGTVNSLEFLKDDTGDRRFWVVEADSIDLHTKIDLDKLWGEILYLYKIKHEPYYLSDYETKDTIARNRQYHIKNEIDDALNELIDENEFISTYTNGELRKLILDREGLNVTSTVLGRALHKRGYTTKSYKTDGKVERKYELPVKSISIF
jgi:hypothetical protein